MERAKRSRSAHSNAEYFIGEFEAGASHELEIRAISSTQTRLSRGDNNVCSQAARFDSWIPL